MKNIKLDGVSDYNKIYFKNHLKSIEYSIELACQILELGMNKTGKKLSEIMVAEVGGGTGIISLVAKWLGIGKVIYSDTYAQSCHDFKIISDELNLKPVDIINGSIEQIGIKYLEKVDLIVSRDVVEHIYNPAQFFKLSIENFKNAVFVHNTSANTYNFIKKIRIKKIQNLDEFVGIKNQIKPGDSQQSFLDLRYKYIKSHFTNLNKHACETLAKVTRGKTYADINTEVNNFTLTGQIPHRLSHATNTCDPANGNWTERLLTFAEYDSFVSGYHYKIEWHFARYDEWRNKGFKGLVIKIINGWLLKPVWFARYISPAIIMVCTPKIN